MEIVKRILQFFIIPLFCLSFTTQKDNDFYKTILSDFRTSNFYLSFCLNDGNKVSEIVISNRDFYFFLNQCKGINQVDYYSTAINILEHGELHVQELNFQKWNFMEVVDNKSVQMMSKKGVKYFVEYYFEGRVLKTKYLVQKYAIVRELFELGVPTYDDDETGFLTMRLNKYLSIKNS